MDLKNSTYRQLHENFMYNHTGSTIWECLFLVAPCPVLIYFASCGIILTSAPRLSLFAFLMEYVVFIVPIILLYTIFNSFAQIFCCSLFIGYLILLVNTIRKRNKNFLKIIFTLVLPPQKRPYITYFRSICNILTALCILAVDFTIFPRRFAKTESYGFGIMDTGVGFFIVSNGLVTKTDIREHLMKSIKSAIPIIALGVIRCISVNALDYQQHITEYGVIWNFFFTLAVVKLICPVILSYYPNSSGWIAVLLAVIHQAGLSSGLEAWVIGDTPRDSILSANREGLVSLLGYASLYFAAVFIGKTLSRDNIDLQEDLVQVSKISVASGIFFLLTIYLQPHIDVSRRLMNLTYITWLVGFSLIMLGLCLIIEISVRIFCFFEGHSKSDNIVPIIVDAVNYNGLFFFILANLFTGFVNLSVKTLFMNSTTSILILAVHMLFITYVVSFMYRYRIRIKL